MGNGVTEQKAMNKPGKSRLRPLSDLLHKTLAQAFAKQGFASTDIVTRWTEIVGGEIADHSEPEKIQWPRMRFAQVAQPGTLVLRVEGPTALEIQQLSDVILERVNRFFGWEAVGAIRLRQAPLRRKLRPPPFLPDPESTARIKAGLGDIRDEKLRDALARLAASIKPP
jgi:hypothetical protein